MTLRTRSSGRRPARDAAVALFLALAAACGDEPAGPDATCPELALTPFSQQADSPAPLDLTPSPYDGAFAAAGAEFDVPPQLLKAVGWIETRWQMVEGAEEFPGRPAAFGVMALRGKRLERGASLAGVTLDAARRDPLANIRAASAILDADARAAGIDRSRPEEWSAIVGRFSGIELAAGRSAYERLVDRALTRGVQDRVALRGDVGAAASAASRCVPLPIPHRYPPGPPPPPPPPPPPDSGPPDYAPAIWRPSPNFNDRAADATGVPHMIIIHTCEGNYTGCWSWLVNPVSQVSAHYVVDEDGTEMSQLVREHDRAWHIAANYDCTLNDQQDCWLNGVQSNHFTVGIEHAGFASQSAFPTSQIEASAALVCDITRDRDIPRDWQHIVGHGQLQPANRTDPGPNWPWVPYLHSIQRHCDEVVVDDDDLLNEAGAATVDAPSDWIADAQTPGYYGNGYRWASTQANATDGVSFAFFVAATESLTLDARWTSGPNRSPRAEYLVIDAAGDTLAMRLMDQTAGGGEWQELGTWTFTAGWNRVVLRRRDTPGFVVVADAVRARRW